MAEKNIKTLILMYHDIKLPGAPLDLYDVALDHFKSQMEFLRLNSPIPGSEVMLTFDDGYQHWAGEVLQVLNSFDLKACFFVCLKFLKESKISKEDILSLKQQGMIIGSHGVTHHFLHCMKDQDIFYELTESKKVLEDITGEKIKYFSVPRGVYNQKVLRIAREAGYEKVFTSDIGLNQDSSFALKRVALKRDSTIQDFCDILRHKNFKKMAFKQALKDGAKKMFGIEFYNKIRNFLIPLTGDE